MGKATPTPVCFEAEAIRNAREYAGDAARRAKEKDTQIEAQAAEITRLRAELAAARREGMKEAAKIAEECYRQNGLLSQRGFPERYRAGLAAGAQAIAAAIHAAAKKVKP
jgi:hypothetical protein